MTGVVAYVFRAELRSRWRRWLGLALVVGLSSGAVVALVSGARRTDSAYARFLEAHRAYDVLVVNSQEFFGTAVFDLDELAALPQVAWSTRARSEALTVLGTHIMSRDGAVGGEVNRFKFLEGRPANPSAPEEIVVGYAAAEALGVGVGDVIEPMPQELVDFAYAYSDDLGDLVAAKAAEVQAALPGGLLRVVGVAAAPGEVPPHFADLRPTVHHTPAFTRLLEDVEVDDILLVGLHGGAAGVDEFLAEVQARSGGRPSQVVVQRDHAGGVERAIGVHALALWVLAGLTGLAGVLILGQVLTHFTYAEAEDPRTLAALGLDAPRRVAIGVVRLAAIGVAGALVGTGVALAASPLFPLGLAGVVEPTPGAAADVVVLAAGAPVTALTITLLGLWPAWSVARLGTTGGARTRARISGVTRRLAVLPPSAAIGVRMAVDAGRGPRAVPVRTTVGVVTLSIATLAASLTFGASLAHLLATPDLYGVTWDVELSTWQVADVSDESVEALLYDERVAALAIGSVSDAPLAGSLEVAGHRGDAGVMEPLKGATAPPIGAGRRPEGRDEIALGARTARTIGVELDEVVPVRMAGVDRTFDMRVVGVATLPVVSERAHLGEGVLLSRRAVFELLPPDLVGDFALVPGVLLGLAPGADTDSTVADAVASMAVSLGFEPMVHVTPTPDDIVNLGRVEFLPLLLGGIVAAIAAGTLAHLLWSAARRRRQDLAIVLALGFLRRQVAAAVITQAVVVTGAGLLVGLPVGVGIGRQSWLLLADQVGFVPDPVVPVALLTVVVVVTFGLAVTLAAGPARSAGRLVPAVGLRAE